MATVKYGAIIVDARGKVGGHYLSMGAGGNVLATNGSRVNQRGTVKKLWGYTKNVVMYVSQQWSLLNQSQRDAWQAASANWPTKNKVGDTVALRGYSLYMKLNLSLRFAGQSILNDPPVKTSVTPVNALSVPTCTVSNITVSASVIIGLNEILVYCASRTQSAGVKPTRNQMRVIQTRAQGQSPTVNIFTNYNAIWGAPSLGGTLNFMCYILNITTGQQSPPIFGVSVVS